MTTFTATEIKAIIEEKGANTFEVFVTVPNNIFGVSKDVQTRMISSSVIGFELDIVNQFEFYAASDIKGMAELKVSLTFTEEVLSELEKLESEKEIGATKVLDLTGPAIFANLKLLAQQGINTFRVNLPIDFLGRMKTVQEYLAANLISNEFQAKGILVTPIVENSYGLRCELHIPNLLKQIEAHESQLAVTDRLYASLEGYGTVRLPKPYEFDQLDDLKSQIEESGEINFSYLIEVSYDEIVDLDKMAIDENLLNYVIQEDGEAYIDDIDHTVVGFNPLTNNLIMKVTGEFNLSNLGSNSEFSF